MAKIEVFSWREAIQLSDLQSTTRLVLFNLSVYMNDKGGNCFPTIDQQAKDTGLSSRAVGEHLGKAEKAGFIKKRLHGYGGQRWANTEYFLTYPEICVLNNTNVAELAQERPSGVAELAQEPNSKKVRNHVPTNSPDQLSKQSKNKPISLKSDQLDLIPKATPSPEEPEPSEDVDPANQALQDFKQHRKQLKKPMTEKAIALFKKRCDKAHHAGEDVFSLIDTAIERGWLTIFPSKKHGDWDKTDDDDEPPERESKVEPFSNKLKPMASHL